jgi:hypothetical protein
VRVLIADSSGEAHWWATSPGRSVGQVRGGTKLVSPALCRSKEATSRLVHALRVEIPLAELGRPVSQRREGPGLRDHLLVRE